MLMVANMLVYGLSAVRWVFFLCVFGVGVWGFLGKFLSFDCRFLLSNKEQRGLSSQSGAARARTRKEGRMWFCLGTYFSRSGLLLRRSFLLRKIPSQILSPPPPTLLPVFSPPRTAESDQHAVVYPGEDGPDVDPRGPNVASQREALRRPAGSCRMETRQERSSCSVNSVGVCDVEVSCGVLTLSTRSRCLPLLSFYRRYCSTYWQVQACSMSS